VKREKVKRLILCKGQIFGEDECLNMIFNAGQTMPEKLNYTVTCDSTDAEILYADIGEIYKQLKGDRHITKFLNN